MSPRTESSTSMVDDDSIHISPFEDAVADDKRKKQMLLIDTITKNCASSPHEILQQINHAIHGACDGSKLEATILSGGCGLSPRGLRGNGQRKDSRWFRRREHCSWSEEARMGIS
jgi:hypothetical protein